MKTRISKISRVISLAETEERQYAQMTGNSQSRLNQQLDRLGELNAHRQAYAERARKIADTHSAHWKDYQNFLYRLDEAVRSQQSIVNDCEQALESHRRHWMSKRRRVESLQRVFERYQDEQRAHGERREQKLQDDLPAGANPYDD